MDSSENIKNIKDKLPQEVTLVAVSKTKPNEDILRAYQGGQRIFGENKAQELIGKQAGLPSDIKWHFIGHLQRNKVKFLAPFVALIESVDSFKLLKEINKEGKKCGRVIPCLLQFHIATEETKFGLSLEEAKDIISSAAFREMKNVKICGVMGMATFTDDKNMVRKEFRRLKAIFDDLKAGFFQDDTAFKELSMGMSGDYLLAIEEGSTMVRIGSAIFGERNK